MKKFIIVLMTLFVCGACWCQNNQQLDHVNYIVKFEIKQSTFTLDPFEHIKNRMNAIEVEIPVTKEFYDKVTIGQQITKQFKYGSLIFNGDFSNLKMKVTGKRTEKIYKRYG